MPTIHGNGIVTDLLQHYKTDPRVREKLVKELVNLLEY